LHNINKHIYIISHVNTVEQYWSLHMQKMR